MKTLVGLILQVLLASSFAGALQAGEWKTEIVDPGGGGRFASMRIDAAGNAHVAYMDLDNTLKYSFWDRAVNRWFTTAIDRTGGFCALTLDSKQRPHISDIEYGTGKLKYIHWDGSKWQKQTIESSAKEISFYTSIALDVNDYPTISFYEYFSATGDNLLRLRAVSWNGARWEIRTADATPGSGKFNSIASDPNGNLHIGYANVKYEGASLRYARWNGKVWEPEIVEGVPGTGYAAFSVFIALDKEDLPHLVYTDVPKQLVKYASRVDGKWKIEVVDSLQRNAYPDRNGLAFDKSGQPYVSYYDAGIGCLKVAHKTDRGWRAEIVSGDSAGYTNSLQIHDGTIWVAYADEATNSLKVSHRALDDAGEPAVLNRASASDPVKSQAGKRQ
jgi:hypothetical protein